MSSDFIPLSSQLGVAGTSYRIQLGKMSGNWAARILKGKDVVAQTTFTDATLNGNLVVGFVLKETAIPNLNPYQIMKTVQFLTREAQKNEQTMKEKGSIPAPSAQPQPTKQPAPSQAAPSSTDNELKSSEDVRASYRVVARPQASAEEQASSSGTSTDTSVQKNEPKLIPTLRKLDPVPTAGSSPKPQEKKPESKPEPKPESATTVAKKEEKEQAPAPTPSISSSASTSGDFSELIKKIESLEKIMLRIEDRLIKIEDELFK